jgi:hypothetical protein
MGTPNIPPATDLAPKLVSAPTEAAKLAQTSEIMPPGQFAASRVNSINNSFGGIAKSFGGLLPTFLSLGALYVMWKGMEMIITGKKPNILGSKS